METPINQEELLNAARMAALEQIALECFMELCAPLSQEICKARLEAAIDQIAPGCGLTQAYGQG